MKTLKILVALVVIFAANLLNAQSSKYNYSNEPGFFDFGDLSKLESGPQSTEVLLPESMIQSIAEMSDDDAEVKNLLNSIKFIRVNSFGITEKNAKAIDTRFKEFDTDLLSKNWERMISTNDKKGGVSIYVKNPGKAGIDGLVILAKRKNGEATFVNIVGKLDLKSLGKIGGKFNIPNMHNIGNFSGDEKHSDKK
ncbi:MAG TPA: DUF4252 domain-containing protein [Melioribacteraceae bacterium]|nr:DUF4252 domain-containing protein [Melioribacteraceae bacterium]